MAALLSGCGSESSAPPPCFDLTWCLLENFDTRAPGNINDVPPWVANTESNLAGATVTAMPFGAFASNALVSDPGAIPFRGNSYRPLERFAVGLESISTLYFQVVAEDLENTYSHFGLTHLKQPHLTDSARTDDKLYQDFEVQVSLDHGRMRVRNGNASDYLTNINVQSGVIYSVWIVVNHPSNSWEIFIQGGDQHVQTQGLSGSTSTFGFRNQSDQPLQTLYFINSPDNVDVGRTAVDNIYMNTAGANLTHPGGWP